jgi:hypothetical protein
MHICKCTQKKLIAITSPYIFHCRQVGPTRTSSDCRLHFEKYYIENISGDFSHCLLQGLEQNATNMRVDEPISCEMRTQEITSAPLGAPIRPIPGSTIFKGKLFRVTYLS